MTDSSDPTNPHDSHTESQIRRALSARAEETTVSPDALDNIRHRRTSTRWARPAAYAAVASIIAVLAGVAIFSSPDDAADPLDVAGTTTTLAADPGPTTTGTAPPTSTTAPPVSTPVPVGSDLVATSSSEPLPYTPTEYARAGLLIWPLDDRTFGDGQAAAADWARVVLSVGAPQFSAEPASGAIQGDAVDPGAEVWGLLGLTEGGGAGRVMTRVVTASPDGGRTWVVTHALSDELSVDLVEQNTADTIRVTGSGRAFEGTAHLTVDGGEPALAQVGGGEFSEFSVVVDADPGSNPIIRIEGSLGIEDGVPDVTSFAATPAARSTDIVVFGVADDDVLNVRIGTGTESEIVATLAPDAAGIVQTGASTLVGSERWWEIVTPDGVRGFVNSRYLSVQRDVALAGMADRLLESTEAALADLDPAYLASTVEIGGIGVFADWPTPFTSVERDSFDEIRNWSPAGTEDRNCTCDLTVAGFLDVDTARWNLAEYQLGSQLLLEHDPGFGWSTGLTEDFYGRFATVTAYIPAPNPDAALDWRRYTVVWEFEDGTPLIRGIWLWGWTP